jgi:hypothetical protein
MHDIVGPIAAALFLDPPGFARNDRSDAPHEADVVAVRRHLVDMSKFAGDDGVLVETSGRLLFTKDIEFASPSAAAAVVHGGHANGLTAWKDASGKPLRELEVV